MASEKPWFQVSDTPGNEFDVDGVRSRCEALTRLEVQVVREHYARISAAKCKAEVRKRVQEIVTAAFIAMRKEDRYVFVDSIPLARMSMPGQQIAHDDLARYATDLRNLKGFDAHLCEALRRFARPFLTWVPPSPDAMLFIDLVD